MPQLDEIKKKIEQKAKEGEKREENKGAAEKIDSQEVDKIVERMKRKYTEQGMEFESVGGKLGELRSIIAEGEQAKINVQTVEDLQEFKSPIVKQLGKFYVALRGVLDPIAAKIRTMPLTADITYYLYSANMRFSASQWIALALSISAIAVLITLIILGYLTIDYEVPPFYFIAFPLFAALISFGVMCLYPKNAAQKRGDAVSVELPFALRHMSTELKAGISLYKTIQTIAAADYGVLSQEFERTVTEIEEGTDAKEALRHFALRTQSKALRSSLLHVVRAMKTGGNLSEIMNTIADDVSFDLRVRVRDYAEKMNFFGVIYIFIAIVAPVFLAIIGAILNSPISVGTVNIPPIVILTIYLIAMPAILVFLVFYLKLTEPKV